MNDVWRMVALGIESGRESENLGRTEFDTKAAGFTALYDDRNASLCHDAPTREWFETPELTLLCCDEIPGWCDACHQGK